VDVGSVATVSEVPADSIFKVQVHKVGEFLYIYRFTFQEKCGGERGLVCIEYQPPQSVTNQGMN
jgi:hypothetical protein